jgi:hypothetical protein
MIDIGPSAFKLLANICYHFPDSINEINGKKMSNRLMHTVPKGFPTNELFPDSTGNISSGIWGILGLTKFFRSTRKSFQILLEGVHDFIFPGVL